MFQWGWLSTLFGFDTGGPLMSFMPIMVTGILYGLAMGYQVFLVSSMREAHVHGIRGRASVVHGFDQASRVVVAAAVIMISVFSGFIFSHDIMIKQVGFALAIGIALDAFLVRMTLMPALMDLLADRAWWLSSLLDRLLPNLDVEGDKLVAMLNARDLERTQTPVRTPDLSNAGAASTAGHRRRLGRRADQDLRPLGHRRAYVGGVRRPAVRARPLAPRHGPAL